MDERIEKAFAVANYMATLSNQKRIILEEYNQKSVHYLNGASFKVTPDLISFTKIMLDLGHTTDVAFVDSNNFPIVVSDVQEFFNQIVDVHLKATTDYAEKYKILRNKRKISDIIEL
jgi:hypothetical protein